MARSDTLNASNPNVIGEPHWSNITHLSGEKPLFGVGLRQPTVVPDVIDQVGSLQLALDLSEAAALLYTHLSDAKTDIETGIADVAPDGDAGVELLEIVLMLAIDAVADIGAVVPLTEGVGEVGSLQNFLRLASG